MLGVDDAAAKKASGVLAVLTHTNAPKLPGASNKPKSPQDRLLQFLQDDEVRYDGQPVALVVADSLEHARGAAAMLKVTYASEKAEQSIEDHVHEAYAPKQISIGATDTHHGDADAAFAKAPTKIAATYIMQPNTHNPMELHATIATWQGDDALTVYDATQGGFGVREKMATLFGLKKENVRVISHYLGGGFGSKGSPWSHVPLAVLAAKVVKRPVKLMLTRQQMFAFVGHRPRTVQRIQLGADSNGKLLALKHELVGWTSRFDEFVEPAAAWSRIMYACNDVTTTHRLVRLDVSTPTFTRGPGAASGSYAMECAMDELAATLKLDPLELRLRKYAEKDPDSGKPFSSKELRACYKQGAERFGWSKRKPEPRMMRDGDWLVGYGMATASYPAHMRASSASATLRADGTVLVQAGTHDLGTGAYTIMTQIAADELGLPIEKVRFELGDTILPEAPGAGGSQTSASVGSAVKLAAATLRAELVKLALADAASPLSGLLPADVDVDGGALVSKDRSKRDPFVDVLRRAQKPELAVKVDSKEKPERAQLACHSFGAQFAEVRVDPLTGEIASSRESWARSRAGES